MLKMAVPIIVTLPGLLGLAVLLNPDGSPMVLVPESDPRARLTHHTFNDVLPLLMGQYLGPGLLGLGVLLLLRLGYAARFIVLTMLQSATTFRRPRLLIRELYFTGVLSLIIILVSGLFVGMVLGLQGYETLQTYGSESALGVLVALSLVRELGPVVSALLFASRAGSAMTAEIGLMKAVGGSDGPIPGIYLALVTLVFTEAVRAFFKYDRVGGVTGGATGIKGFNYLPPTWTGLDGRADLITWFFWLSLGILIVVSILSAGLIRSRIGRAMVAVRDNETAAAVMGVNLFSIKTVVFGLSGAIAGVAGSLFALKLTLVEADVPIFGLFGSVTFLVAMVVGGAAQNWGPFVGAMFYVFVNDFARTVTQPVSYTRQDPNGGLAATRNAGIAHASADWIAFLLHGLQGETDHNNALKLGFDPGLGPHGDYPAWMKSLPYTSMLPSNVRAPGTKTGAAATEAAMKYFVLGHHIFSCRVQDSCAR